MQTAPCGHGSLFAYRAATVRESDRNNDATSSSDLWCKDWTFRYRP